MSDGLQRRTVRLLVPGASGDDVLVDEQDRLPSIPLALGDGETTLLAVVRCVLPSIGLHGPVIDCFIDQAAPRGEPIPTLVEHAVAPAGWSPPDGWGWAPVADAGRDVEQGLAAHLRAWIEARVGGHRIDPLRPAWGEDGWYQGATAWIEEALAEAGMPRPATISQFRQWGISAVMRVESSAGRSWFKAVCPHFVQEAGVTLFLDRALPGAVAPVIGADTTRGWLLLADVGSDSLAGDPHDHGAAVEHLVSIQRAMGDRIPELLAAGCRHRPLGTVPEAFAAAVADPIVRHYLDITPDRVDRLTGWLTEAVARIDELGIPDTLVHGDFHPGNVTVSNGHPVLFDWSDAAVSHPFVDVITWAGWLRDDPAAIDALWASFLQAWRHDERVAAIEPLRSTFVGIAGAYHVISYAGIVTSLDALRRAEHADGLVDFFAVLDAASGL